MRRDTVRRLNRLEADGENGTPRGYVVTAPDGADDTAIRDALDGAGVSPRPVDLVVIVRQFVETGPAQFVNRW